VSSFPTAPSGPRPPGPGGGAFRLGHHGVPAAARWHGRAELRADLRAASLLAGGLVLAGVPAGLLWWWLAPRADFRVTADGPVPIGPPPMEISAADDSVFVLILAGLGLLAGLVAWLLRGRRGVAILAALALGATGAAVVAWRLGELLAPAPTDAELTHVGGVVTTPVDLSAVPALAAAPFVAVLAYLVGALAARDDGLGRTGEPPGLLPSEAAHPGEEPAGEEPVDARAR
jgi:hypothetical protein